MTEKPVDILQQYLRINTSNPPGNEKRAVEFLFSVMHRNSIPCKVLGDTRERPNLIAWLPGERTNEAVLLVNHMDVVPAVRSEWTVDPFGGEIKEGCLYGRGALDMKGHAVAQLFAFLELAGRPLLRPILFLSLADEEDGCRFGAEWITQRHPELFSGCQLALTEGGGNKLVNNRIQYFGVVVSEKTPCWIRVTASGRGGHASKPGTDAPVHRLIEALHRILNYDFPVQLTGEVEEYFRRIAQFETGKTRLRLERCASALSDSVSCQWFLRDRTWNALLRTTVAATVVETTVYHAVIPTQASAILDCRLLPGVAVEEFLAKMSQLVDGLGVALDVVRALPNITRVGLGQGFRRLECALKRNCIGAEVVPCLLPGSTDGRFFRALGIECCGISPFVLPPDVRATVHSSDERIPLDAFENGVDLYIRVMEELAIQEWEEC